MNLDQVKKKKKAVWRCSEFRFCHFPAGWSRHLTSPSDSASFLQPAGLEELPPPPGTHTESEGGSLCKNVLQDCPLLFGGWTLVLGSWQCRLTFFSVFTALIYILPSTPNPCPQARKRSAYLMSSTVSEYIVYGDLDSIGPCSIAFPHSMNDKAASA